MVPRMQAAFILLFSTKQKNMLYITNTKANNQYKELLIYISVCNPIKYIFYLLTGYKEMQWNSIVSLSK